MISLRTAGTTPAKLPIIVVLLPMVFYVFTTTSTVGAVLFLIWNVVVGVSDTFLKPLFLGRGMEVPMLVILIGALALVRPNAGSGRG